MNITNEFTDNLYVDRENVQELLVNLTYSNVANCNASTVMRTIVNTQSVESYSIDVSHMNTADVTTLVCANSSTQTATMDQCSSNIVHVLEDVVVGGNVSTSGALVSIDSLVELAKYVEIENTTGGTALQIEQSGFNQIVAVHDETPVFKIFDGGVVNICRGGDTSVDRPVPQTNHLLRVFGNAMLLETEIGILNAIGSVVATGAVTMGDMAATTLTSTGSANLKGPVFIKFDLNTSTASINGSLGVAGDIIYNGTSTIARFQGLDSSFGSSQTTLQNQITNAISSVSSSITSTYAFLNQQYQSAVAAVESAIQNMINSTAGLPGQRYAQGETDGYNDGDNAGYNDGYSSGYTRGYNDQYQIGYNNALAGQGEVYYSQIGFNQGIQDLSGFYGVPVTTGF